MITIDIATGRKKRESTWRNQKISWDELCSRLSATKRTEETLEAYSKMAKDRQDKIKDVGGFVGGYLREGKRDKRSIVHRQLLTLDIDKVDVSAEDVWDTYLMLYGNTACIYSTHKHCPEKPRLRLVIPLSESVDPDQYQAISRRVADNIGMRMMDPSTFQPERLMYWPSTSSDGEYFFRQCEGPELAPVMNPHDILRTYHDWRDVSSWPSAEDEVVRRSDAGKGVEDPLQKVGLIGLFCREFTIVDAIETFLPDLYTPTPGMHGRYTYTKGTASGGLTINKEGTLAYSHHSTDPASGHMRNAFDLVRIHLYKDLDSRSRVEGDEEPTDPTKLPSYKAMVKLIDTNNRCGKRLVEERLREAERDFKVLSGQEPDIDDDHWTDYLKKSKGGVESTCYNVEVCLKYDPKLKGAFRKNLFEHREEVLHSLPWFEMEEGQKRYYSDVDDSGLRSYLEQTHGISGLQKIVDAVAVHMQRNAVHPPREWLNSLVWDGVKRVDTLFIDYLGAEDNVYTRQVAHKSLTAAVARILNPGCKYDQMTVLVGPQGIGKSTLLRWLGGQWFSDTFILNDMNPRSTMEQLQGVWIVEVAELASFNRSDENQVKSFLSKSDDRYRVAYGRRNETFPRECVFFGTCNDFDFLKDPTGNRRFWPVDCGQREKTKDLFAFDEHEREQLFAEAKAYYEAGEELRMDPAVAAVALATQEEHGVRDEREGIIEEYLEKLIPEKEIWDAMPIDRRREYYNGSDFGPSPVQGTTRRMTVSVAEIWVECLCRSANDMTTTNTKPIHNIMKQMKGWVLKSNKQRVPGYGKIRVYERDQN